MQTLTKDIPLDKVSWSLITASTAASVTMAQYVAVAQDAGYDVGILRGSIQNDPIHFRYCGFRRLRALRTQQILAYETGLTNVADPLGGSYYIENLTDRMEEESLHVMKQVRDVGGMEEAIRTEWLDRQFESEAVKRQKELDSGEKLIVGVNVFTTEQEKTTPLGVQRVSSNSAKQQVAEVKELKRTRDMDRLNDAIKRLRDDGVYIRSMASRGYLGGLSRATYDVIRIMEAMGNEVVIVETLGAGQDEVDVIHIAHTCLVVVTPGMGDDIQAMKAGIMEIADIIVLNKADLDGANTSLRHLQGALAAGSFEEGEWMPRVVRTVSAADKPENLQGI
ncbi:MAG TPA: hypothetical protein HPP90_02005 [Deltaproteobacteria bacterium]|nr:hypothetical protein [Deltaproteobacteria bacterium]